METPEHERIQETPTPRRDTDGADGAGFDPQTALGNAAVGRVLGSSRIQRDGATSAQQLDEAVSRAIEERQGQGKALDPDVRERMEAGLGHDLSDVRIHTDDSAHSLNEAVDAKAFTAGQDVFFKRGAYDPSSNAGQELLGHELTHVIQQRTGTSGLAPGEVSDPSDTSERQAADVGRQLASDSLAAGPAAAGAPSVGRQAEEEEEEVQMSRESGVARQAEEEEEEMVQTARETSVARQVEEEEELQTSREP